MTEQALAEIDAPSGVQGGMVRLTEWAGALVVQSAQDYEAAVHMLKDVKTVRASIVEFFRDPKTKAHATWKAIVAKEKGLTERLDAVERQAKGVMLTWQRAEQEKARAEQERLRRIEEERARKEREKLAARAAKAAEKGKAEKAEELLAAADAVEAVVPIVQSEVPKVAGASTQRRWVVKAVDKAALVAAAAQDANLLGYLKVDESALQKIAMALKGQVSIPGVVFDQVESMRIGR